MNHIRTFAALITAFLLGVLATAVISGCQQSTATSNVAPDDTVVHQDEGPEVASANSSTETTGPQATTAESVGDDRPTTAPASDVGESNAGQSAASDQATTGDSSKQSDKEVVAKGDSAAKSESSAATESPKADSKESAKADDTGATKEDEANSAPATDGAKADVQPAKNESPATTQVAAVDKSANAKIEPGDWHQWGGTSYRNNVPVAKNIPVEWTVGKIDRKTGEWQKESSKNVLWVARLGSQTYGNPVVAGGQVYVGTNNTGGYLKRYPSDVDLGVLLAFKESDGSFQWQDSSEKLPTGRVHDWPLQGICSAPYVEGARVWYVTSRGEIVCLDAEGFHDGEDDGPVQNHLGRLFDVVQNEDAEKDKLAGIVAALGEGKISEELAANFKTAGLELPQDAELKEEQAGRKWSITAKTADAERRVELTLVGAAPSQRLSAFKQIGVADKDEADRIWVVDMMSQLQVSQHNMCSCSITALGDLLFINTSNGVDETHVAIPQSSAPSFICVDKNTAEIYWTDNRPGQNILHGQWSSPAVAELGGVPQVIFGGGDGWVYSFKADKGKDGKPELLWEFDANPKDTKYSVDARSSRNHIIATPVIYDGLVYVAVGEDPEHGEGDGHLWCIDPTKRGDVSAQLAVSVDDRSKVLPKRRLQAIFPEQGEIAIDNPNSAAVWHFSKQDRDGDGKFGFEETMHRTCGTVAIKDDLLYVADFSGLFHCLDAKTGKLNWTYDMLAASWGSPMIVGDKVYIGDEDGDVAVFELSAEPQEPMAENTMGNSVYTSPVVANDTLFIANKTHLFALRDLGNAKSETTGDAGEE